MRCLATRFDKDSEDGQGRTFSHRHRLAGNGIWVKGAVWYLYADKKRVKVKWDDGGYMQGLRPHLEPLRGDEESGSSSTGDGRVGHEEGSVYEEGGEEESGGEESGEASRSECEERKEGDDAGVGYEEGDNGTESDCDSEGNVSVASEGDVVQIGETVQVGDLQWKRVASMGIDRRGDKPQAKFRVKDMEITRHTDLGGLFEFFLPVSMEKVLSVVQRRARQKNACLFVGMLHG